MPRSLQLRPPPPEPSWRKAPAERLVHFQSSSRGTLTDAPGRAHAGLPHRRPWPWWGVGMVPRAWGHSPTPRAPLPSPLIAFGVFESQTRSLPPGYAAAVGASLAGSRGSSGLAWAQPSVGLERSASGPEKSLRWSMARWRRGARGLVGLGRARLAGNPGAPVPGSWSLAGARGLWGSRRPGSPAPASGGGSWLLQSATGLPQPTVPPTYIAAAALAPGFRLPGPLPFREAPALAP